MSPHFGSHKSTSHWQLNARMRRDNMALVTLFSELLQLYHRRKFPCQRREGVTQSYKLTNQTHSSVYFFNCFIMHVFTSFAHSGSLICPILTRGKPPLWGINSRPFKFLWWQDVGKVYLSSIPIEPHGEGRVKVLVCKEFSFFRRLESFCSLLP